MSARTVFIIIIVVGVLFVCGHVAQLNGRVLQEHILFHVVNPIAFDANGIPVGSTIRYQVPVWGAVLGAFLMGFLSAFLLYAVRLSRRAVLRLRDARAAKKRSTAREKVEQLYAEGLQAVLADRPERAEGRFRDVIAQDPNHYEALMAYGEVLRADGRPREAADIHRRATELRAGDVRPLFALAADWRDEGDYEKARRELEKVIQRNPRESLRAQRELREVLITAGRWEDAKKVHDKIELAAKDDAVRAREQRIGLGIRHEIAGSFRERKMWREAERELRSMLRACPEHVPANLALGDTLLAAGDAKGAATTWRQGYEVSENPIFLARLEDLFLGQEDPQALLKVLTDLVEKARNRAVPSFYLGKVYLRLEMIDEAESMFDSISQRPDDALLLRYVDAKVLERRGRCKEAAEAYRSVIKDSKLLGLRYRCTACGAIPDQFEARCSSCRDWGTLQVSLQGASSTGSVQRRVLRPEWASAP